MTERILITGASGFIGSRVAAAALAAPRARLRLMTHRTPLGPAVLDGEQGIEAVYGDFADAESLRGSCDGVDAVIHCASLIGGSDEAARAVNDRGTRVLVGEAVRSGVARIVYLSTAAVYGRGPFTGATPDELAPAPASETSRTRAAAEQHVLAAGGIVLRPHLVYGAGDRWMVPGLVHLLRQLSAAVTGCGARHSLIDVRTLGRVALAAALSCQGKTGVYHVNHPEPVACSALLEVVASHLELPWAAADVTVDAARALLSGEPRARHHLDMLAVDHWFADDRVWRDLDCDPGAGFAATFPRYASWYRRFLA